jgi:hypothetical protein
MDFNIVQIIGTALVLAVLAYPFARLANFATNVI